MHFERFPCVYVANNNASTKQFASAVPTRMLSVHTMGTKILENLFVGNKIHFFFRGKKNIFYLYKFPNIFSQCGRQMHLTERFSAKFVINMKYRN